MKEWIQYKIKKSKVENLGRIIGKKVIPEYWRRIGGEWVKEACKRMNLPDLKNIQNNSEYIEYMDEGDAFLELL